MKVCFIWTEKFRNFEDFGFNLSSSLKFAYDSQSHTISVEKQEILPEHFFGESIVDVVGIIGKNGAGKSNALELVCKVLKGGKTSLKTDFLIIMEIDNSLICFYSYSSKGMPFAEFKVAFEKYEGNINPLKVVFFSNVFDERINEFDKEVSDISVNNLHRKRPFQKKKALTDFEKQIKLIDSKIFQNLNVDLPTDIQITSKVWVNRLNNSFEYNLYSHQREKVSEFKKMFRDRLRSIKPDRKFAHILIYGFFIEKITEFEKSAQYRTGGGELKNKELGNFIDEMSPLRTEEITERILDYLEQNYSEPPQSQLFQNNYRERFNDQIRFLKRLRSRHLRLEYNSEGARNRNFEYFSFKYQHEENDIFLHEFIGLFEDLSFFDINWLGLSSGHKAYLNLFASLYQELKLTKSENLLLCIDEGDLYLHPKWQVEFFDKLLSSLPVIFNGKIQLILTSHSPFLLSDLPKQNITILGKEYPGSSLDGVRLKKNTFGGNLYDLYAEPFFLGQRRTSDFAFNKIKEVISEVENKKLPIKQRNQIRRIIDILGMRLSNLI